MTQAAAVVFKIHTKSHNRAGLRLGRTPGRGPVEDRAPGHLIALVGELSIRDADFRTWWTSHPVHGLGPVPRTFQHPVAGTLTLDVHQLSVGTNPDLILAAYTAQPGSRSREALRVLLQSPPQGEQESELNRDP